ncbi:MAG TPA: hypothetical protein VH021_19475 [Trebonia sp.]|nr:hypothetical protein [Trebonia sp.]
MPLLTPSYLPAYLTGLGVPFRQFRRGSLFIRQEAASGALIEIRQAEG